MLRGGPTGASGAPFAIRLQRVVRLQFPSVMTGAVVTPRSAASAPRHSMTPGCRSRPSQSWRRERGSLRPENSKVTSMNRKITIVALLGFVLVFANYLSAQPQPSQPVNYKKVTSQDLNRMLGNKDFSLVNVHIPYQGEIAKTDAFIPYNEIAANLTKLPSDKNAKIVLYCRSGAMSRTAAEKLTSLGYTNVYDLSGGMIDWEKQGFQLIKK
jgi:rhodanese-related sulfurtransferase